MVFWTIVHLRERKETIKFLFKFFREIILLPFIWGSQKSKPGQFTLWNISEEEFSIYELKTQL